MKECKKKKYPTKILAYEALKRIRWNILRGYTDDSHGECRIYQCPHCAHWHLTSMTKE